MALPPPLKSLLEELESPSPSIQELPANLLSKSDDYGDFFPLVIVDEVPQDTQWWQVRLRLFTAIGNCRTLRSIDLESGSGARRVKEAEARALLEGLVSNPHPVLEELNLSWWDGFGTVAACEALASILRGTRTLQDLQLVGVGMTSEGVGHIAAALEANSSSPLRILILSYNAIGDVTGAQHLARILATTPTLETLGICEIGLDVAGAEVIANVLAQHTTLQALYVGCEEINDSNDSDSAALTKLVVGALSGPSSALQGTPSSAAFNHSIKRVAILVKKMAVGGGAGLLGEAVAQVLRSNTTVTGLEISTSFLSHGLDALAHNTTIAHLRLLGYYCDDVEMEMLIPIVGSSHTLKELDLELVKKTTVSFKRALFQSVE